MMPEIETMIEDSHGNPKPVCEWTTEEKDEALAASIAALGDQLRAKDFEIKLLVLRMKYWRSLAVERGKLLSKTKGSSGREQ